MKYPRFFALILTIIIAILIFSNKSLIAPQNLNLITNYLSSFTLGVLYVYGFTAAFATGALLTLSSQQNIILTGLIAGLGSVIGDLIIFKFIRHNFNGELESLAKTKPFKKIRKFLKTHSTLNKAVPFIAYIFIASPLPDEIGVSLIASYKDVSQKTFSIFAYLLNTAGIFIILLLGKMI